MTGIPHPSAVIAMAEAHRAELHAEAARDALARSAQATSRRRPHRAHLPIAAALAVALLLAMGIAAAHEQPRQAHAGAGAAAAPPVSQAIGEHLLDPSAARQVAASRL